MFTGIVEAALEVLAARTERGLRRFEIDLFDLQGWRHVKLGDSIALNGCCLTVAQIKGTRATFEAVPQTLSVTTLGDLRAGAMVNVERAVLAGARLDGHLVQGHVDGIGTVAEIQERGGEWRIHIRCGREFAVQCIERGSVCVDGISLTIAELAEDRFTVAVVPHTRKATNIKAWRPGTRVNLEADIIGKYVRRQMEWLKKA